MPPQSATSDPSKIEAEASALGADLSRALARLAAAVTDAKGPVALSKATGVDKVLASRILGAVSAADPIGAVRRMPGPEPLRRFVKAAASRGADAVEVRTAREAIDRFEALIRARAGDRSGLDAMLSAWVPEARAEFELRRKQAAFRAVSQIKGVAARALLASVVLTPSADPTRIDVTWLNGLLGLHRVRPGAAARVATRRIATPGGARTPLTLDGQPITWGEGTVPLLERFCSTPLPALDVRAAGEAVHYTLGGGALGEQSAVDLVFAERNPAELLRHADPEHKRWAFFFAEAQTPAAVLQFDLFVHEDLYPGQSPTLRIYDTAGEGVASPNDPTRDMDTWPIAERIDTLEPGPAATGPVARSPDIPRYTELLTHVLERLDAEPARLRGFRCRVAFPLHGSQVTMMFRTTG